MSGRVTCILASIVRDSVALLRRCETRALREAWIGPGDSQDTLLSGAGLCSSGHACGRNPCSQPPSWSQSDSLCNRRGTFSATASEQALNCAAHSGSGICFLS